MPIVVLLVEVSLQLMCAAHVVRTGRDRYWIWIILAFPLLGCIAYFVAEMLPELLGMRGTRQAMRQARRAIDPEHRYRLLAEELATADTAENRKALAEECLLLGKHEQAIMLYRTALVGVHKHDANLMHGLARALFSAGDYAGCVQTLDALRSANPKFQSADAHLLYARSLEGAGRQDEALQEYAAVSNYFAGAEARCRYALLLQQSGHNQQARQLFTEVVRGVEKAGGPFKRAQREWYDIARQNLA